ncbi:MAG: lactonase family protein [Oscillospiraceae bacterium]|nr:lactonase family protein [Oscillospiraceae bacterium]
MSDAYLYISRWPEFVGEPGIALLRFRSQTGEMKLLENLEPQLQCNATCLDMEKNILYINNEVSQNPDCFKGGGGLVYAYQIDPETGRLTQISRVPACCPNPAYLSRDPSGKYLICANHSGYFAVTKAVQRADGTWGMEIVYDDATVNLYALEPDGRIGDLVDVAKHTGQNPGFLLHAHPHSAVWAPSGAFFAVCDKGEDSVHMYRIDYARRKLAPMGEPYRDEARSAPRYCLFHPTEPYFYNNHEGNTALTAYRYNAAAELEKIASVRCLPDGVELPKARGFKPGEKPAQQTMVMSADGAYIYDVLNGKGVDGVSVFRIAQDSGIPELIQYFPVDGKWARGAAISPDGGFLVVACMDGDGAVLSYRIQSDGTLESTGFRLGIPGAAYVTFYPAVRNGGIA